MTSDSRGTARAERTYAEWQVDALGTVMVAFGYFAGATRRSTDSPLIEALVGAAILFVLFWVVRVIRRRVSHV